MKKTLLDCLRDNIGRRFTSSELLLRTSLTRSRLYQEVRHLRQAGYVIDHRPRHGYRLKAIPDRLIPDEIHRGLKTHIIGRDILTYKDVDSTMDVAARLAEKGAREGTTVFAERQRAGKGRVGRHWYCPGHKGILMTTILRPHIKADRIYLLTVMMTVATAEAIRDFLNLPAYIKWPNDVIINNKKVCGVLVETKAPRGRKPYFLAGIGINANLTGPELPKGVIYPATSLLLEKGSRVNRIAFSQALLMRLDGWYAHFKKGDYRNIRKRGAELCPMIGHRVRLQEKDIEYTGKILDLSAHGGLVVELDTGARVTFRGEHLVIKEITP
ncbi:MAG: biotin--[acetyl-CoA-carboxylase] ligase [Candidatus Brocadiales bacterium]|nr:biotin--[acetyl-CoA-carboxylase] ligase [Candidatus Bathyanammoxibius amoris]